MIILIKNGIEDSPVNYVFFYEPVDCMLKSFSLGVNFPSDLQSFEKLCATQSSLCAKKNVKKIFSELIRCLVFAVNAKRAYKIPLYFLQAFSLNWKWQLNVQKLCATLHLSLLKSTSITYIHIVTKALSIIMREKYWKHWDFKCIIEHFAIKYLSFCIIIIIEWMKIDWIGKIIAMEINPSAIKSDF